MSTPHETLVSYLDSNKCQYQLLAHRPSFGSKDSAVARQQAGLPESIGAKAIVIRAKRTGEYYMVVLPGTSSLNSKAIRSSVGKFRFATEEELQDVSGGLSHGAIPPFGQPVLPGISQLLVCSCLRNYKHLGFNAACQEKSIVLATEDYYALPLSDLTEVQCS